MQKEWQQTNELLSNIEYIKCNAKNVGPRRLASDIKYLVYHYTANDGDTARGNCLYYQRNVVEASAHYFVDDDGVKQSVDDLTTAWAVGGKKWNDCCKTGGGKLYGICTNHNSISIEMCDHHKDGTLMATGKTLDNAVALGKMLMKKYNIPLDRVIRHFDVTGKHCPAYFMDNSLWNLFKSSFADGKKELEKEESEVIEKRYNSIDEITEAAPWATPTITKLIDKGAIKGTGNELNLTMDMLRLLTINDRMGVYDR